MIENLVPLSYENVAAHEAKWGKFNEKPNGWRAITQEEFATSVFFSYMPTAIEFRQVKQDEKRGNLSCYMYYYWNGTGIALASECTYTPRAPSSVTSVKYFAFGCKHEYAELSRDMAHAAGIYHAGRCYHVTKCTKCGHVWSYDSSD